MSVNELSLATDITVDIQKPLGNLDVNGRHDAGHFGINSQGAYFDTAGATLGETAALGWDASVGAFFIEESPVVVGEALHLMVERVRLEALRDLLGDDFRIEEWT